jgi:hypothetical protein
MALDQADATSGEKLMSRLLWFRYSAWLLLASASLTQAGLAAAADCGDVVNVATHEQTTMRYAFRPPAPITTVDSTTSAPPTALRALFGVGNIRRLHILWAIHEHT